MPAGSAAALYVLPEAGEVSLRAHAAGFHVTPAEAGTYPAQVRAGTGRRCGECCSGALENAPISFLVTK